MKKGFYIAYVIVVCVVVIVAGSERPDSRNWGGGTGRTGWSSGGGHK